MRKPPCLLSLKEYGAKALSSGDSLRGALSAKHSSIHLLSSFCQLWRQNYEFWAILMQNNAVLNTFEKEFVRKPPCEHGAKELLLRDFHSNEELSFKTFSNRIAEAIVRWNPSALGDTSFAKSTLNGLQTSEALKKRVLEHPLLRPNRKEALQVVPPTATTTTRIGGDLWSG